MRAHHLLALRLRFCHVAHLHLRHHSAQTHGRTSHRLHCLSEQPCRVQCGRHAPASPLPPIDRHTLPEFQRTSQDQSATVVSSPICHTWYKPRLPHHLLSKWRALASVASSSLRRCSFVLRWEAVCGASPSIACTAWVWRGRTFAFSHPNSSANVLPATNTKFLRCKMSLPHACDQCAPLWHAISSHKKRASKDRHLFLVYYPT